MLTFKDWIYTHKFSDLELEILKNIDFSIEWKNKIW